MNRRISLRLYCGGISETLCEYASKAMAVWYKIQDQPNQTKKWIREVVLECIDHFEIGPFYTLASTLLWGLWLMMEIYDPERNGLNLCDENGPDHFNFCLIDQNKEERKRWAIWCVLFISKYVCPSQSAFGIKVNPSLKSIFTPPKVLAAIQTQNCKFKFQI